MTVTAIRDFMALLIVKDAEHPTNVRIVDQCVPCGAYAHIPPENAT